MYPDPRTGDGWGFYIARPGASASECIDWIAEGIRIVLCGLDNTWSECTLLSVPPQARVRISYTFQHERCIREIILTSHDLYLEGM